MSRICDKMATKACQPQRSVRLAPTQSKRCPKCQCCKCACSCKSQLRTGHVHADRSKTIMRATRKSSGTQRSSTQKSADDDDNDVGTAEQPTIPGFGREDVTVARKFRDNSKYLSTQDVMSGPFRKKVGHEKNYRKA